MIVGTPILQTASDLIEIERPLSPPIEIAPKSGHSSFPRKRRMNYRKRLAQGPLPNFHV